MVAVSALALAGCRTLLQSARTELVSERTSYRAALSSLARITPCKATREDVHSEGPDPPLNPAISVLHFADTLQRFTAVALVTLSDLERGIRDCLRAGRTCIRYAVSVSKLERNRLGNCWLDSHDLTRETMTQGWRVDAL